MTEAVGSTRSAGGDHRAGMRPGSRYSNYNVNQLN